MNVSSNTYDKPAVWASEVADVHWRIQRRARWLQHDIGALVVDVVLVRAWADSSKS